MVSKSTNATHPGEVIKDELISRGIPQKDFARCIGVPYTMLNDILNERRPLSAAIALYIEASLGISADLLMGLQVDYNMKIARQNTEIRRRLRSVRSYTATSV
ncbi:MAG: HigA family addiction module antidote protein [Bacteroidales bacterium]|nr:HigA family addiction module antidote protein [Bacteroidales bacterium]